MTFHGEIREPFRAAVEGKARNVLLVSFFHFDLIWYLGAELRMEMSFHRRITWGKLKHYGRGRIIMSDISKAFPPRRVRPFETVTHPPQSALESSTFSQSIHGFSTEKKRKKSRKSKLFVTLIHVLCYIHLPSFTIFVLRGGTVTHFRTATRVEGGPKSSEHSMKPSTHTHTHRWTHTNI